MSSTQLDDFIIKVLNEAKQRRGVLRQRHRDGSLLAQEDLQESKDILEKVIVDLETFIRVNN